MSKRIVIFGATGSQGGSIASALLQDKQHTIVAITRNPSSPASLALAKAGAELVQADMNDLSTLQTAVKGANVIFGVTDFITAGSIEVETQHGENLMDAALTTLDTLELFIWSNLPDARVQRAPYQNVLHFNSKNDIAKCMGASNLKDLMMEVRLGPYYENMTKAPQVYGPQKFEDGSWKLMLPVLATSRIPFTSVRDLGRLVQLVVGDVKKFQGKKISVVNQEVTPDELLSAWNKAVGLTATFQPLSTEEFKQRLLTVHGFPEVFALSLAENLSVYRDDPEAWVEGTDFAMRDLVPGLKTWEEYVKEEDWDAYFKTLDSAKLF